MASTEINDARTAVGWHFNGDPNDRVECALPPASARRFEAGHIVTTPGALTLMRMRPQACACLGRHLSGDWGDVDTHDAGVNAEALEHGYRLLSTYSFEGGDRLWIITEADRSATTILLPEEY